VSLFNELNELNELYVMHNQLLLILGLLFAMALLYMLSQKVRVPYPIFLVIGGLLIGFIPGIPLITIDPDIIFTLFLPPLLYEAAWFTSWREFWGRKRSIAFFAFGLVILTSIAVAYFSTAIIPGFTLALGFLLGGIISPPDAVAATSVLKEVKVPRRLQTILEGESLVNDASSLIVFRVALATVMTGQFIFKHAVMDFFVVAIMGIVTGIVVGLFFYFIHRLLPTNASIDTILTLMTPYIMYLAAEQFHFSGILAVVSGGLFLSYRSHDFLNYESRIQATSVWSSLVFLLNGLVFILIGLQLPVIIVGLEGYSLTSAVCYAVVITLITIAIRIILVFPSAYIPRYLSKGIREREARPPLGMVFMAGWAGMRGVVSLAAALAIPLALPSGEAFPHRNLILFITFVVIFITLVFQGLTMPFLLRFFKLEEIDPRPPHDEQLSMIRLRMAKLSVELLDGEYDADVKSIAKLNRYYEQMLHVVGREEKISSDEGERDDRRHARERFNEIFLELVENRRRELVTMRNEKEFDEEVLREYQHTLDLEEARMRS
jgi:CPA1 family monovalent cation:H+ antiporter